MRLLFLCTGNSCRSQMAEAWARHVLGGRAEVFSAGLEARGLDPRAVRVMAEAGVPVDGQTSTCLDELPSRDFDVVITVCGHAHEHCPVFPGEARVVHVPFDDPPRLAESSATEEEALRHYRRVRDEIRVFAERLPDHLAEVTP